jgi:hypothetical protein
VLAIDLGSPPSPPRSVEDHLVVRRPARAKTALNVRALNRFLEPLLTCSQSVLWTKYLDHGRKTDGRSESPQGYESGSHSLPSCHPNISTRQPGTGSRFSASRPGLVTRASTGALLMSRRYGSFDPRDEGRSGAAPSPTSPPSRPYVKRCVILGISVGTGLIVLLLGFR